MAIDWGILNSAGPPDIAGNFAAGFKMGRAIVDDAHQRSALAAYAQNPGDPAALSALYRVNPELAAKMEENDRERADYNRKGEARGALADYLTGPEGIPQPRGLTGGVPNALTGQTPQEPPPMAAQAPPPAPTPGPGPADTASPAQGQTGQDITVTANRQPAADGLIRQPQMSDSWKRYVQAEPEGAMKTLIDRAQLGKEQALALAGQMDLFGRMANGVTDQASYDQAKAQALENGFDTSHLPAEYSPQAVASVQAQSMSAKDYIKQKWDITDDQIDNAETARHHQADEGNARRGQDVRSGDTQRGQDQASTDRRRGQDQASADRQRGQDQRGTGHAPAAGGQGSGRGLVRVKSIEEARALAPGTMFIDPNGNVRKR